MKEFANKVALITGAGNGFGKVFAIEAAKRGMKLALVEIDRADLTGTAAVIKNMGAEVLPICADVTLLEDVKMSVEKTLEAFGQIDLLFCNAGVAPSGDIFHLPPRDWQWTAYANVISHGYYLREVLPIMIKQGTPAHIMTTASVAGIIHGVWGNPAYCATKHAAVVIAEDVSTYCKTRNLDIGVSVYCPGYVQTDLHHCERRRPARFQAPDDPYYQSEHFKATLDRTSVSINTGFPLDPVGPRLFKAIEDNQLYVLTHPQYIAYYEGRHRGIESFAAAPNGPEGVVPGDYKGKVALITGAASGFGLDFAKSAAKRGMKLALVDIDVEKLEEAKAYFDKEGIENIIIPTDVSLYEDVKASIDKTMEAYGQIDLAFLNAGVAPIGDIANLPGRDWAWTIETNVLSHAYYYRELLPIMKKQGTPANILATASVAGCVAALGTNPAYSASKHGAVALTESIIMGLKDNGLEHVKIGLYCPGFVQTDLHNCSKHRPERFRYEENDPYYQSEHYKERFAATERSILTGYPIDGVGERLFKGIDAGEKYILTHGELAPVIKMRHAAVEADGKKELELV